MVTDKQNFNVMPAQIPVVNCKEQNMRTYNKQILLFSLVIILLCFLGVFIFTLPAFINRLDLSSKDNIGDAIGGLTALE